MSAIDSYPESYPDEGDGALYQGEEYMDIDGRPDPMPVAEFLPDQAAFNVQELDPATLVEETYKPVTDLSALLEGIEPPEGEKWVMADFDDLRREQIKPGLVINGVKMIRYYNEVEQMVVDALSPVARQKRAEGMSFTAEVALAAESSIARDRIANHLRPKTARTEFVGSLLNGQAIILPLDTARAPIFHHTRAGVSEDPNARGMNVLYTGLLRSSRGRVGQLVVEASYLVRRDAKLEFQRFGHAHGYLLRGIKISPATANMGATLDKHHSDSVENAVAIARHAIYATYGGAFGTKRRT